MTQRLVHQLVDTYLSRKVNSGSLAQNVLSPDNVRADSASLASLVHKKEFEKKRPICFSLSGAETV
jgi:hypothetical protein